MNASVKKALNVVKNIFVWLVVVIAVFMMIFTIVSVSIFDRTDRNIFGYRAFIVLSGSMSATDFDKGDLVVSKAVDPKTLQVGDIITFTSRNDDSFGLVVTHKIREITSEEGELAFVTYGTTTDSNDQATVLASHVIGQYKFALPKVGHFFNFLKTVPGYIVCILIPFLTLIIIQGINCVRLFRKYRAEQMADLEEERRKIEEERAESQRMMQELLALKAQMASAAGGAPATETPAPTVETTASTTEAPVESAPAETTDEAEAAPAENREENV